MMTSQTTHPAPQSRLSTGVVIAGFCVFLQLYSPQPLLVVFHDYFHASEAAVSLIVSAATLAVALCSPFVGMLADAVGRKRVIVPCLFALAFITGGCGLAQTLPQLVMFRFLAGLCTPGVIAVTLAYISEESHRGTAASVTALYVTGTVLGGLTGRLSSALMADHFSWRYSFLLLGALTFAGALCTLAFLPRSRKFQKQSRWRDAVPGLLGHLRNRRLAATYFTGFCALFCHVGLFTYVNFHLAAPPFSLSTAALGLIFLVYALGILVTPLAGRLIDRLGHRSGAVAALAFIAAGALLTLSSRLPIFILGLALASSGIFIIQAAASSHVGRVARGARSSATGLYVSFYYLGGSVGATALVIPWKLGGWPAIIAAMLGVEILALLGVWRYFESAGRNTGRFEGVTLD